MTVHMEKLREGPSWEENMAKMGGSLPWQLIQMIMAHTGTHWHTLAHTEESPSGEMCLAWTPDKRDEKALAQQPFLCFTSGFQIYFDLF